MVLILKKPNPPGSRESHSAGTRGRIFPANSRPSDDSRDDHNSKMFNKKESQVEKSFRHMEFSQCTAPGWVSQGIFQGFFGIRWTQPTKGGGGAKTPATIKNMAQKPPKPPQIPNYSFWECWSGLIQIPDPTPASTNADLVENPLGNPWKNRGAGSSSSSPGKAAAIWGRGTTGEAGRGFHSRETTDGYGIVAGLSRKGHARKNSE